MSPSSDLPAMRTNPKYIFFTDFDGTITTTDSNDTMTDNLGLGGSKRKAMNDDVLHHRASFRDSFKAMMDSVKPPYDKCIQYLLENIKLDPGFKDFYTWARKNNIPVVVLSSGMEPIIRALLIHFIGKEADSIQIVSNSVRARDGKDINDEAGWEITFHDDSHFGHDKSLEIRKYSSLPDDQRPTMFYAGDGVSDLSAAKETDLLFAKRGHDLVRFCVRENIPFAEFDDWSNILSTVKDIVSGRIDLESVSVAGAREARHGK